MLLSFDVISHSLAPHKLVAAIEACFLMDATSGLELTYEDIAVGDGEEATGRGQTVVMHYEGWLEDGTKFDSSRDKDEPFLFPLGVQFVIPGWDQGIVGMRVGGRRRLIVPPKLGYGEHGVGEMVPPNATLIFEVELLEVSS